MTDIGVVLKRSQDAFREVMGDVDKKLKFGSDYRGPWASSLLETALEDTLIDLALRRNGVSVILAPHGSGKSTHVRSVGREFVKNHIFRGVVYVSFEKSVPNDVDLKSHVAKLIGVKLPYTLGVQSLVPYQKEGEPSTTTKVLFIFDQVENVVDHPHFATFFRGFATSSVNAPVDQSFVSMHL